MADYYRSDEWTDDHNRESYLAAADNNTAPAPADVPPEATSAAAQRNYANDNNEIYDSDRIFVGRLPEQATEESLRVYFEKFGPVRSTEVVRERATGRPRGIGFVIFEQPSTVDLVLRERNHELHRMSLDVKMAQSRGGGGNARPRPPPPPERGYSNGNGPEASMQQHSQTDFGDDRNGQKSLGKRWVAPSQSGVKIEDTEATYERDQSIAPEQPSNSMYGKVFTGGLPPEVDRSELKYVFEQFGFVADSVVMMDPATRRSRGFGFVTFDLTKTPDAVDRVLQAQPIPLHGREVHVKIATAFGSDGSGGGMVDDGSARSKGMDSNVAASAAHGRDASFANGGSAATQGSSASEADSKYCKMFVGGLPPQVDRVELKFIFEQFGVVADAVVMLDPATQRSRCFGFVTFDIIKSPDAPQNALQCQPLPVHGREVEVKIAEAFVSNKTRSVERSSSRTGSDLRAAPPDGSNGAMVAPRAPSSDMYCKMFVGGLPPQIDRAELIYIFEQFGAVADAVVMMDGATQRSRGFGFVTFDISASPSAPERAIQAQPLPVHGRSVEVKYATAFVSNGGGGGGGSGPRRDSFNMAHEPRRESFNMAHETRRESFNMAHETRRPTESTRRDAGFDDAAMSDQGYCKVFVGGLPPQIDRDELRYIFEQFGLVADAVIMMDSATQRSRGFGFVTFDRPDGYASAQRAIRAKPIPIHGRDVEVRLATPRTEPGGDGPHKGMKRSLPPPREHMDQGMRPRQPPQSSYGDDQYATNGRPGYNNEDAYSSMKRPRY